MATRTMTPNERSDIDLGRVWLAGVHYGLSFEEYCKLPYLNASTLCWATASAQHLRSALDGKLQGKETEDKLFGAAMHARILEPDVYNQRYVVAPGCQAKLASGKAKGAACGKTAKHLVKGEWLCGTHVPKALLESGLVERRENVLTQEQAVRVEAAAKAVERDQIVKLLRLPHGGYEATVLFEWQGVRCKARLDKWLARSGYNPPTIIDLKKTQVGRATDDAVERACWEYSYDVKAAFYCRAIEQVTGDVPIFVWVFVEDSEPHGINVVQADDETLLAGRVRLDECLSAYLRGQQTGSWPGYMGGMNRPKMGGLPAWAKAKILG